MATEAFNGSADGTGTQFHHVVGKGKKSLLLVYVEATAAAFGTVIVKAIAPSGTSVPIMGGEEITVAGLHVLDAPSVIGEVQLTSANGETVVVNVETADEAHERVLDDANSS